VTYTCALPYCGSTRWHEVIAPELLLRKVIPDLTHTDLSTTSTRRYVVEVPPQLSDEEWEKKYSLPAPAAKSVQ
jgi:hypothetical protein